MSGRRATAPHTDPVLDALAAGLDREAGDDLPRRWRHMDHRAAAERMRQQPATWVHVNTYRSSKSAQSLVGTINSGLYRAYLPKGAFEAAIRQVGMGTGLFVRYIGTQAPC